MIQTIETTFRDPYYDASMIETVDEIMAEILRRKTEGERLRIAWGMSARDMLRNLLHAQHREWTQGEIEREVARRLGHGTR